MDCFFKLLLAYILTEHLGKVTKSQCKSSNFKSKSSCRISTSNITWNKEDFISDLIVSQVISYTIIVLFITIL